MMTQKPVKHQEVDHHTCKRRTRKQKEKRKKKKKKGRKKSFKKIMAKKFPNFIKNNPTDPTNSVTSKQDKYKESQTYRWHSPTVKSQ